MLFSTRAFVMTDNTTMARSRVLESTAEPGSIGAQWLRRFLQHRLAAAGLVTLALLCAGAIVGPPLAQDPEKISLCEKFQPPSISSPLGTDELGRDQLARVLHGGRVSLTVGLLASALTLLIGTTVGALSGFYGGWLDNVLMRCTDVFLSFPSLFVLIMLSVMMRDTSLGKTQGGVPIIILAIGLLSWMMPARIIRATFLSLREREFVLAARAIGASNKRLILVHILPNTLGPIVVQGALQTAYSIITESGLSYLGLGIQPPTPSWGNMLNSAQAYITLYPWLAIFPGLMIFITVISVNSVGDGLRDAFDPHMTRSRPDY